MSNLTVIDSFAGKHAFLSNFYPSPIDHGVQGPGRTRRPRLKREES